MFVISEVILETEDLRVIVEEESNITSEKIEIKDGNKWVPVLSNMRGFSTLQFSSPKANSSKIASFERRKKKKLYYQIKDEDISLNLDYCLEENNILHVRYKFSSSREMKLSKIGVFYSILLGNDPDYTWIPHMRPKKNMLVGDHVFRSPVIVYKKGSVAFALIPDLKTLGQNRPFQTYLDLNLKGDNSGEIPYISYGYGNYKPSKHVFFKHQLNKTLNIKANTDLTFRYYIIAFRNKTTPEILMFINDFFWKKYVRKELYKSLEPQILPYDVNVKEGFDAIFKRHEYWGNFKIDDEECGGFWLRTWIGSNKPPIKFIKPGQLGDNFANEIIRHRVAVVWNNAWFLNIRSAYGLMYFGESWNEEDYIIKSNQMLRTVLNLPRLNGVFPSLILPASKDAVEQTFINGTKAFFFMDDFHLVDSSLAMYWALKLYQDFNCKDEKIVENSKELVDLISELQLENGAIPSVINFEETNNTPLIREELIDSASSGASLMFLIEYYKITKDERVINISEKIAQFIQNEIIPQDKWQDFEAFYSCSYMLSKTHDAFTKRDVINTLSIYWCAEGFKELYKITNNRRFLDTGEHILSILSLFQQVWNMSYISYNTFGGFGVQNTDAELSDARQALFVRTYLEYYLETGKSEYMERGIAALRASWALQLLEEYREICPGNLEEIPTIDGIDRGCVFENYGHSGKDQRISGYVMFDWGVGTAAMAVAYVKKHFGDLFIDFKENLVWGIDGILIKAFNFSDRRIDVSVDIIPGKKFIIIKSRSCPLNGCEILINNDSLGFKLKHDFDNGFKHKLITF